MRTEQEIRDMRRQHLQLHKIAYDKHEFREADINAAAVFALEWVLGSNPGESDQITPVKPNWGKI